MKIKSDSTITLPLTFALAFISFSSTSNAFETFSNNKTVERLLSSMSSMNEPGVQYVVVNKNTTLFSFSTGFADIKNKIPLSTRHTMAAFSMTKTLTAIAVLQLVEQGKIKLNNQASQYIDHPYYSEITIKQLLSHTSGIPNPIPLKWVHLANNHKTFDEKKSLSQVLANNAEPDALPGEEYGYSNIGYWLLGQIIEKVSGKSYSDYVNENIFKPLNLKQDEIGFKISKVNNYAKGYLKKYSFMNLIKYFIMNDEIWGAYEGGWLHINNVYLNGPAFGGAIGSATAFSRILQSLLNEKSILLGIKVKQKMYAQQKTKSGETIKMTLGWHIGELDGINYYFKEGGGAGFHSEMRIYPEQGIATIIMLNKTNFKPKKTMNRIDKEFISQVIK